jgi:hypothetical protein
MNFFAPDREPYITVQKIFSDMELLTRCIFTQKSTLISKQSGKNFVDLLKCKNVVIKKEINRKMLKVVDMKLLREALNNKQIDVNEFNIHLRSD